MRTQPVWKDEQLVPGDFLAHIISDKATIPEPQFKVDPRRPRFVFNPFRNRKLDSWYAAMYNIPPHPVMGCFIPERTVLPLLVGSHPTIDYESMKADSLDASERYVPAGFRTGSTSDMKTEDRLPVYNAIAMVSAFGSQFGRPTGFCQIDELDGVEDLSVALRLTRLCFPEARTTVDADIEHIKSVITEGNIDDFTYPIVERLLQSMNQNKAWAEEHVRRLVGQLDAWGNGQTTGKPQADRLDIAVCGWLGVGVPKTVSKTSTGDQQTVKVEMVPGQAQETGPQIYCETCGEISNILPTGQPPKMCRGCRTPFTVEASAEEVEKPAKKKTPNPAPKASTK